MTLSSNGPNRQPGIIPEVEQTSRELVRGMGLLQATATNMLEMIGIGPFITIGVILAVMGGPQAVLGWVLGAVFSVCDGLVYAELGAAMPGAGGAYVYFREAFNRGTWGRLVSFLFLWETLFTAPLAISAACVGFGDYTQYAIPSLTHTGIALVAIGACLLVTVLLYRPIATVGRLSIILLAIVLVAMFWVIGAGIIHLSPRLAFDFPRGAFHPSKAFFYGLGAATLFAMYNYGGYGNITYLGGEVRNPTRNIPRAIIFSIIVVAVLYLLMSVTIVGTIPWRQAAASHAVVSEFITRLYGSRAGSLMTVLILGATLGGIFTMCLGYSRVLYAAAAAGDFFKIFGRVHPKGRFPTAALIVVSALALPLCWFSIEKLVDAMMIVQILFQFIPQVIAVFAVRRYRKNIERPFSMWFYPWSALIAFLGWIFVASAPDQRENVGVAIVWAAAGVIAFLIRSFALREWPMQWTRAGARAR